MNRFWPTLALLVACGSGADGGSSPVPDASDGKTPASAFPLQLVAEKKLSKLLPKGSLDDYEASGVVAASGSLYVVFDNTTQVASFDTSLTKGQLGPGEAVESQYEAITATDDGRFYAMVEVVSEADPRAAVAELAADTSLVSQSFTDVTFASSNKGLEGIAWLNVAGTEYLLGLCQNNDCKNDDTKPGKGRLRVLRSIDGVWITEASLKLPESAEFLDYSDVAVRADGDGSYAIVVVSHRSSALWRGTLTTSPWALVGQSTFFAFPRSDAGEVRYCSVEGVTFLGPSLIATVSDKSDGSKPCSDEEESIHIFQLPH